MIYRNKYTVGDSGIQTRYPETCSLHENDKGLFVLVPKYIRPGTQDMQRMTSGLTYLLQLKHDLFILTTELDLPIGSTMSKSLVQSPKSRR
jgi:hypothetical protein